MGLSPQVFWGLTWWDWYLEMYKYWRNKQREDEQLELAKILVGRMCATVGNFAGKTLKGSYHLTEKDFFHFEGDTVADQADIENLNELMSRPEIKYRFLNKKKKKKDGQ